MKNVIIKLLLIVFFFFLGLTSALAQQGIVPTKLVNPEWEFFDDFEESIDNTFWQGAGVYMSYGVNRPDASSKVLEARYVPNSEGGGDSWSEYDFNLGIDAVQVEVSFRIFIPADYVPIERNHKLFYLWSGPYGSAYSNISVNSETWGSSSGALPSIHTSTGATSSHDLFRSGHYMNSNKLPVWKPNEGVWSTIQIFMELATEEGDFGYYEIYKNGVLLTATYASTLTSPGWNGAPDPDKIIPYSQKGNFIDQGTLLGWANGDPGGGFLVDTKFLIDDFRIRANSVHGAVNNSETSQYTLTTNTTGSGSVVGAGKYDNGKTVTLAAKPDSGWQFDRWSGGVTGTDNPVTITMDAAKTVTAIFKEVSATTTDTTAPAVTSASITITGNIPNATALKSGSATGVVQDNGDFTITVAIPNGTSTVTLTATQSNQSSQTSTIDINIDAAFSTAQ